MQMKVKAFEALQHSFNLARIRFDTVRERLL